MPMQSVCDRMSLRRLRAWRIRLLGELKLSIRDAAHRRLLKAQYDALQIEIAEQNCKRQNAMLEGFKGESRDLSSSEEVKDWCWNRY